MGYEIRFSETLWPCTVEIVRDNGEVAASEWTDGPPDTDFLAALVAGMDVGGMDAETLYTTGHCDLLAVALREILDRGHVVAVVDPWDEAGAPICEGPAYMIHAGLLVGDMVLDVNGLSEVEKWAATGLHSEAQTVTWTTPTTHG